MSIVSEAYVMPCLIDGSLDIWTLVEMSLNIRCMHCMNYKI